MVSAQSRQQVPTIAGKTSNRHTKLPAAAPQQLQCSGAKEELQASPQERVQAAVEHLSNVHKLLGNAHADAFWALSDLALRLVEAHRAPEAEPLQRRAWSSFAAQLGVGSKEALECLNRLGNVLYVLGRAGEAEACYRQVLLGFEGSVGWAAPETRQSAGVIASILAATPGDGSQCRQERLREACTLRQRIADMCESTLGARHPDTLAAITALADCFWQQGNLNGAERTYRRALVIAESTMNDDDARVTRCLTNLAAVLNAIGAKDELARILERRAKVLIVPRQAESLKSGQSKASRSIFCRTFNLIEQRLSKLR